MKYWNHILISTLVYIVSSVGISAQETYSLQDALRTARENNPHLQSERMNIDIAETEVISAKLRPNLTFSNETVFIANSSEFEGQNTKWNNSQNREEMWQLSKPIQIAGQRKNKIAHANKSLELEEQNYFETERNLFADVASKWLDVWTSNKQLEIIATAKTNVDSLLLINQARYRNQVITQTDLFRTELLAKQYKLEYKTAEQELLNEQTELKFLLGASDDIKIDTADEFLFSMPEHLEELLQEALDNRSDIKAARTLSEVSDSNIKLQRSLSYPEPEIGLIYNPQNSVPHFGIAASIDLPFFDRNQGEIKRSQLEKQQAEIELETLKKQIQNEITIAYATYQVQKQNIEDYQELLEQSETILSNVRYAYIKGGTTFIDFLEAQSSWLETQQEYYELIQEYRQSYIQLLYTTGLINQLAL